MGLEFIEVEADAGTMGGADSKTHEFQVIADAGEDSLIYCQKCGYAANIEKAQTKRRKPDFLISTEKIEEVDTPDIWTIEAVCKFFDVPHYYDLKSLVYTVIIGDKEKHYMALLLGDDDLNELKLKNFTGADHIVHMF